jgi:hypothetical protein
MHVFHSTNLPKNTPRNTFLVVQQLLWLDNGAALLPVHGRNGTRLHVLECGDAAGARGGRAATLREVYGAPCGVLWRKDARHTPGVPRAKGSRGRAQGMGCVRLRVHHERSWSLDFKHALLICVCVPAFDHRSHSQVSEPAHHNKQRRWNVFASPDATFARAGITVSGPPRVCARASPHLKVDRGESSESTTPLGYSHSLKMYSLTLTQTRGAKIPRGPLTMRERLKPLRL